MGGTMTLPSYHMAVRVWPELRKAICWLAECADMAIASETER